MTRTFYNRRNERAERRRAGAPVPGSIGLATGAGVHRRIVREASRAGSRVVLSNDRRPRLGCRSRTGYFCQGLSSSQVVSKQFKVHHLALYNCPEPLHQRVAISSDPAGKLERYRTSRSSRPQRVCSSCHGEAEFGKNVERFNARSAGRNRAEGNGVALRRRTAVGRDYTFVGFAERKRRESSHRECQTKTEQCTHQDARP